MKNKKVIFLRHGESYDDVHGEFGGWSDREPTVMGYKLADRISVQLRVKYKDIQQIYSSPLKRALLFAKRLGSNLNVKVTESVLLKERNTYGLLNGLTYEYAKEKYPNLVKLFDSQEFIPGSERYDDFVDRVGILIDWIKGLEYEGTVLCVTQGYLMTTILEEFLGKVRDSIGHGSYFVCEIKGNKLILSDSVGITYLEGGEGGHRKFKS